MSDISNEQRNRIVEKLAQVLLDNYIYPETAEEMANAIKEKLAAGEYDDFDGADGFATQLTTDLQLLCKDKHLNIHYNAKMFANFKMHKENPDDDSDLAKFREMWRYDNYAFRKVERLMGNIGYIKLDGFMDADAGGHVAIAALQFVSGCDALIFDLRDNTGGSPSMIQLITSYFFKEPKHLNTFYWRPDDNYNQFWTQAHVQGKKLVDMPLYVITSSLTFSAAEEFAYNLKHMERATIIGETTGGGAHPVGGEPLSDDFVVIVPKGRAINPITESNWEGTGVEPHIVVPKADALEVAHVKALEDCVANSEDEAKRAQAAWELATAKASYTPVELDLEILESCAGLYGDIEILHVEGHLIIKDRFSQRPLLALNQTLFADSLWEGVRLEFVLEEGEAKELKRLLRDNPHVMILPKCGL